MVWMIAGPVVSAQEWADVEEARAQTTYVDLTDAGLEGNYWPD